MLDIEKDAKALLENAKKLRTGESKGASAEPSPEKPKTEVKEVKEEPKVEAKAEVKEEVKVEKVEETAQDKEKRSQEKIQKRFDEMTAKMKELERDNTATKLEKESLRSEIDSLRKDLNMTPEVALRERMKKDITANIQKHAEEDKDLHREDRREMSKEELEEWKSEDYDSATEWEAGRNVRRIRDKETYIQAETDKVRFEKLLNSQQASAERVRTRHPELDITDRKAELEKQGKSKAEINKILSDENPKFALGLKIVESNPEKYLLAENGPELIADEIDKINANKDKPTLDSQIETLLKEVADLKSEMSRMQGIDVGITSTRAPESKNESDTEKRLRSLAKETGLSPEKVIQRLKTRDMKGYGR
ncbi:MAG: hypothetical protein WC810_03040 [Janthinobacterium sp.]|jgi:hypothetical protein